MSLPNFNYAAYAGIHSVAAPIVFAALYAILLVFYLLKSIKYPVYVFIVLTFFCTLRVTAFILRAILADSTSAAHNLNLLIAEQVISGIGFFGLLYSAYNLIVARLLGSRTSVMERAGPVTRIVTNRPLFRLVMTVAVILGTVGISYQTSSDLSKVSLAKTLRKASIIIFLVLTILLAVQVLLLAREEVEENATGNRMKEGEPVGKSLGIFFIFAIVALLVAREAFFTATINDPAKQQNERFFYPLAVATEFIAVCLFAVPGLVPTSKEELPR